MKDASFIGSNSAKKRLWDKEMVGRLTSSLARCALSTPERTLEAEMKKLKVNGDRGDSLDAVSTPRHKSLNVKLPLESTSTGNGGCSSHVNPELIPAQPGTAGSPTYFYSTVQVFLEFWRQFFSL